jgi:hypothetical protein
MYLSITNWNLNEAARILSCTAKGLKLEYMIMGENTRHKINIKPGGPIKYLYQGPFPRGLIFNIYDSHFD